VKFWKLLAKVVDTTSKAIHRKSLPLHAEKPAKEDKIWVRILGATATLRLAGGRNEVSSSVVVEESETDLLITASQGSKDLLNLFGSELTI
jgi:hypothetical protein